ncbi:MAG: PspC domain-containing protein [Acidobacteria bacterium]|nr:PspC domain-containing protein [Acidobacteriota bacterium]
MTCKHCHRDIPDEASYCLFCGRRQGISKTLFPKALRRSRIDRKLAGICGGVARYLDTDPVFIRVAWVILSIFPGTILLGVLAYVGRKRSRARSRSSSGPSGCSGPRTTSPWPACAAASRSTSLSM